MKKFDFEPLEFVDSFVVFLDVLGFSEFVYSEDKAKLQQINVYLWVVEKYLKKLQKELDKINKMSIELGAENDTLLKLDYILISDSIIITVKQIKYDFTDMHYGKFKSLDEYFNDTNKFKKIKPIKEKQKELYLLIKEKINQYNTLNKLGFEKLCGAIEKIQKTLASLDVWLRGAITAGTTSISTNKKQIVGRAYIDAYKLESKAIYPRVIIDEKIIQELYYENEEKFIKGTPYMFHWDNVTLKKDIPLFIDYMRFPTAIDNKELVKSVVKNILNNYKSSKGKDHHIKYEWMAKYMKICLERESESYSYLLDELNNIN